MARHQIIYTSCMRGIDGVNDGQQIFSYDAGFTDNKADEVKSLFTYQVPSLPPGVVMDEKIVLTIPSAYSYRHLDSGKCAVTLNTYLGRDYMGSAGRFGNHLSHSIICVVIDFDFYPCELYGSTILRSYMEYEEVNNPNPPKHLPVPELEKGYKVDIDNVIEFLGIGDNLEHYKNMLYALLRFRTDRKRIIICDVPENIIMWIAALEYTLPLEVVKKINFTTYEFDPELSPAQICGVIPDGTKYNAERYASAHQHFIFDFLGGNIESFGLSSDYFGFVDTAMSYAYDSLTDFHSFINENFYYCEADERILDAYTLYQIESDGMGSITQESFESAIKFVKECGKDNEKKKLIYTIINNTDTVNSFNDDYALCIIRYLLESMDILGYAENEAIKQLIVNRILVAFSSGNVMMDDFLKLYDTIDDLAKSIDVSFASELMKISNRNSLLQIMQQGVTQWKMNFIIRVISEYVIACRMSTVELEQGMPIGKLYFGILKSVYETGRQNGFNLIENILKQFEKYSLYLVNMTLNLEGYMADLPQMEIDIKHLWDCFYSYAVKMSKDQINEVFMVFSQCSRYKEMYLVYKGLIAQEHNLTRSREIFRYIFDIWFKKDHKFEREYLAKTMNIYADSLKDNMNTVENETFEKYSRELLQLSIDAKVEADFVEVLAEALVEYMPLQEPIKEDEKMIISIISYQYGFRRQKVGGKLLLIAIGMMFGNVKNRKDIVDVVKEIKKFAIPEGADLRRLGDKTAYNYFEWIIPAFTEYRITSEDMADIYGLFQMTRNLSNEFMNFCCKEYYKLSKDDKDYSMFCEFLKFMFSYGDSQDRENAGKVLCKLSKHKMEELDEEVKQYFKREVKFTKYWGEVVEVAGSTNPLLNNISSLFKRRKD